MIPLVGRLPPISTPLVDEVLFREGRIGCREAQRGSPTRSTVLRRSTHGRLPRDYSGALCRTASINLGRSAAPKQPVLNGTITGRADSRFSPQQSRKYKASYGTHTTAVCPLRYPEMAVTGRHARTPTCSGQWAAGAAFDTDEHYRRSRRERDADAGRLIAPF
jgi:hypothetical protein